MRNNPHEYIEIKRTPWYVMEHKFASMEHHVRLTVPAENMHYVGTHEHFSRAVEKAKLSRYWDLVEREEREAIEAV